MNTDQDIYTEFARGDLKYMDAIKALMATGYTLDDATQCVSEWVDMLEREPNWREWQP